LTVELDLVALAVEQTLEQSALGGDQFHDASLDAALGDEVVDLDWTLLPEAVDASDALLQDGRVPGELEVDDAVGGPLEIEPDAAGVGGEQDAQLGIVVEIDQVLLSPSRLLLSREERGFTARFTLCSSI
jgi:hypothetical protein